MNDCDHLIECRGCGERWISEPEESPCSCVRGDAHYEDWKVTLVEPCPDCAGRGRRQLFYSRPLSLPCTRCDGRGWLALSLEGKTVNQEN